MIERVYDMKYKAILFDLDGTLLPMDNDVFTKGYFKELAKKLSLLGIDPEFLIKAVWTGTKAMVKNDGTKPNIEVFWETFAQVSGKESEPFKKESDSFYLNEFEKARAFTGENPLAKEAVKLARSSGAKVICASNPLFPLNGQVMRMSWVGIEGKDFDYISSYESESYSKPNPKFFTELCRKNDLNPEECLFIGNDVVEDMQTASSAGLNCYLVTDWAVMNGEWNGMKGTFADLLSFLEKLQ